MRSLESNSSSNIVEVDGILFETLMPFQMIRVPQPGERVAVQVGVRITNQRSTSYRFGLEGFVPEMFSENGQTVRVSGGMNARRWTVIEDIPLISPESRLTFWMSFTLNWMRNNCLMFGGRTQLGASWQFLDFQPGIYQFRFSYRKQLSRHQVPFGTGRTEIDSFWVGKVSTPSVEFYLI